MKHDLVLRCPHCQKIVSSKFDSRDDEFSNREQLVHLLEHATMEKLGVRLSDLGDMSFWDYSEDEITGDDYWGEIASMAADLVADEMAEACMIFGDQCSAAVYEWFLERYPGSVRVQCNWVSH